MVAQALLILGDQSERKLVGNGQIEYLFYYIPGRPQTNSALAGAEKYLNLL
jgi:hypothetical protein